MARYIKIFTDNKRRLGFQEKWSRKDRLKYYLTQTTPVSRIRRFQTYCQLTGASRSVYYGFALSRHSFRKCANHGLMPGVMPSSW